MAFLCNPLAISILHHHPTTYTHSDMVHPQPGAGQQSIREAFYLVSRSSIRFPLGLSLFILQIHPPTHRLSIVLSAVQFEPMIVFQHAAVAVGPHSMDNPKDSPAPENYQYE